MNHRRLWRQSAVQELLGVLVGAEVDGSRGRHTHQVRAEALEQRVRTLLLNDDPEKTNKITELKDSRNESYRACVSQRRTRLWKITEVCVLFVRKMFT